MPAHTVCPGGVFAALSFILYTQQTPKSKKLRFSANEKPKNVNEGWV
jgi:hypothetical protein